MTRDAPAPGPAPRRAIDDLWLATAGHHPEKRATVDRPFAVTGIGLVVRGRGTYRVNDGRAQRIEGGCLFPVYPGPRFRYGPDAAGSWDEHYVCVLGPGVRRWVRWGLLPTDGRVRPVADTRRAVALFEALHTHVRRAGPGDADRALAEAARLLVELYHARSDPERPPIAGSAVDGVLAHCERRYDERIDFRELARQHAVSYSALRQQFRRMTGLPPAKYLTRLRCEAACRLLHETQLPVAEVGRRVGIPDPYTFSRSFKRAIGLSPLAFRRSAMR